jgi:hypothetical protein
MKYVVLFILSFFVNIVLYAQPTSGLIAYWSLDGNYTNTISSALNGTNFSSTATTNKNSVANKAMAFANTNTNALIVGQYATIPVNAAVNFTGTQNFTISFYALFNSPFIHAGGLYDNCLNYGGSGCFFWNPSGFPQINFNYKNGSVGTPNGAIPLNTWLQLCLTRDNGTLKIYVDGVLVASAAEGATAPAYSFPARLGSMFYNSYSPPQYNGHNGKLDEFRIYNRALTLAEIATLLPIKLNSFSAKLYENETVLHWQTAQEINSSHFEIERSIDGISFIKVGSTNAFGNSTNKKDYEHTDKLPATATVQSLSKIYYRLKSVDLDGRFTHSEIVTILLSKKMEGLIVFPSPAKEKLNIQTTNITAGKGIIDIIDCNGKIVLKKETNFSTGINSFSVNVSFLKTGNYYLRLQVRDEVYGNGFVKVE